MPQLLAQQRARRRPATVAVSAVYGRARFAVPALWQPIVVNTSDDTLEQYAYYIPKPGVDSSSGASTNFIVNIRRHSADLPFKIGTSWQLATLLDSSNLVLHDTTIGRAQRAVFWRADDGPWIYIGFDDFGRVGNLWVHVRIVEPLSDNTPASWGSQFEDETRAVLRSFTIDGKVVFPASVGYPALVPGPAAGRRGAPRLKSPEH